MTTILWKAPDNHALLILIQENGGSIEDILTKFRNMEPAITRPVCCPLLRVVAERCHELSDAEARALYDLFCLCV